jgi:hypothetical protein
MMLPHAAHVGASSNAYMDLKSLSGAGLALGAAFSLFPFESGFSTT